MLPKTLILIAAAATTATAQATVSDPQLVGTWVSKSGTVVTGPVCFAVILLEELRVREK